MSTREVSKTRNDAKIFAIQLIIINIESKIYLEKSHDASRRPDFNAVFSNPISLSASTQAIDSPRASGWSGDDRFHSSAKPRSKRGKAKLSRDVEKRVI